MKRMIQTLLLGLFFAIIGMDAGPLPGQVVETVEVEGHIVSDEPQSKNLLVISSEDLERMNVRNFGDVFGVKIEEIPGVPTPGRWMYISILYR